MSSRYRNWKTKVHATRCLLDYYCKSLQQTSVRATDLQNFMTSKSPMSGRMLQITLRYKIKVSTCSLLACLTPYAAAPRKKPGWWGLLGSTSVKAATPGSSKASFREVSLAKRLKSAKSVWNRFGLALYRCTPRWNTNQRAILGWAPM